MLEELKKQVCTANIELFKRGVVIYTWGNASGIDRRSGLVVIKPSGVDYLKMGPDDMVVVDMNTGKVVEGKWAPSSDTNTHLILYRSFGFIGGVAHTHSTNAVAFAQAGQSIPVLGTTHADSFFGNIPCTRSLSKNEVESDYETNTGKVILETFQKNRIDPAKIPGVVVRNHGPFTWGRNPNEAVYNAVVLERISEMDLKTLFLNKSASIPSYIIKKHYERKHGSMAYYGQKDGESS